MEPTDPNFCILCYFLNLNRKPTGSSELLLLGLGNNSFHFSDVWQTAWGCAGDAWGVPVRVVELRGIKGCNDGSGETISRHSAESPHLSCGLKRIMESFTDGNGVQALKDLHLQEVPRWIFFFDVDTLPLPKMDLRSFLDRSNSSLYFFENFQSGAIYPATLLARVNDYSRSFFSFVDQFYHSMRNETGVDSLHHSAFEAALLHWLQDELQASQNIDWVDSRFKAIRDPQTYDRYVATARYVLGPRRRFAHLVLLRRGHGFCADMVGSAVSDLGPHHSHFLCFKMQSPMQDTDAACLAKVSVCEEWISSCMLKPVVSENTAMEKIRNYRPKRMGLGMVNDVEECWPTCGPEVPADVWQYLERGLHFNAKCANGHCRLGCCCKNIDIVSEQRAADSANEFLLILLAGLSAVVLILCCFLQRKRIYSRQQARSNSTFPDLTSPRAISVEMISLK